MRQSLNCQKEFIRKKFNYQNFVRKKNQYNAFIHSIQGRFCIKGIQSLTLKYTYQDINNVMVIIIITHIKSCIYFYQEDKSEDI